MLKFFQKYPEVLAVMSEKTDGSMKLFAGGNPNADNRNNFFKKVGISEDKIISAGIANGVNVELVSVNSSRVIKNADGLVTKDKNIYLSATVADCIPVYFYDPVNKIVALAHAGWRGIVNGIIENTINKIIEIGGSAKKLKVALGPGISACHFEIKEDILVEFKNYSEFIIKINSKMFADLKGIIRRKLANLELRDDNVENNNECTYCGSRYFSYRRDKPKIIEAMVAVIGMKE